MNRNTLAKEQATMFTVDAKLMPLSLPTGSAIFAYSGEVWITQEGMHEDVILGPGERFTVHSGALILASAIRSIARVYVAYPAEAAASVDSDVLTLLRRRARRLQAEQFYRVAQATRQWVLSALAAVYARIQRVLTQFKRAPGPRLAALTATHARRRDEISGKVAMCDR